MSSAAKVGLFMLIILAILGYFILKIEDIHVGAGESKKVTAIFDSTAGLNKGSDVRVAGVPVGKVKAIRLRPDGKAEVEMDIDRDVQLHQNAAATVANLGLLGEKYVDIQPGSSNAPLMSAQNIQLRGSQAASIDDVTSQISAIAGDVKAITASLRNVMGGPAGQQRLEDIVENIHSITAQVRELIAANQSSVNATLSNARAISESLRVEIPRIAQSIDSLAAQLGDTVGENRGDVKHIVENLRQLSTDLKTTTDNVNAITGQMRSGEGTVGKLIYSNEAHDRLTAALTSVESGVNELKTTLGRANRISLDVGMAADVYAGMGHHDNDLGGNTRSTVFLRLNPNPDRNRFFNITFADDPRGHEQEKIFKTTVTDANGNMSTTTTHETKIDRNFLISAQAGWRITPFSLRVGLFDNSGGIGADYLFTDRLEFTGEAFDFGHKRDNFPHFRLYGEYTFRREKKNTPQLFLRSGVDNFLNDTAFTFGGGIRWRDDDLKYLLGTLPLGR
jgi:phospholipid/cholesterol/gamma-HCH transport system substrate-binding protein